MRTLAIDTSLNAASSCVYDSDSGRMIAAETVPMDRGHAEALLPLIERVIAAAVGGFQSLDRIAVTVGPGSFTGIRVGISAAKAFGISLGLPVVGVSTLAAFASQVVLEGGEGTIVAAIDARHGQVYAQAVASNGRMIVRQKVTKIGDFIKLLGSGPIRFTGSGAANMIIEAWAMHVSADVAGSITIPSIECIARLGTSAIPALAPPNPLYLKPADVSPAPIQIGRAHV